MTNGERRTSNKKSKSLAITKEPAATAIRLTAMYDLAIRTRAFACDILRFCDLLPRSATFRIIENQLARAGTSTAANYRASRRAQSRAAFIAKMSIVEEEVDETRFWLDLLTEVWPGHPPSEIERLMREANELTAIVVASKKTARRNNAKP